jgi:polyribonucleotide 5'-hydroxyl-kinase
MPLNSFQVGVLAYLGCVMYQITQLWKSVNVVVVLGHERLYSDMTRILRDKPEISVVKVAKSGGVSTSFLIMYVPSTTN